MTAGTFRTIFMIRHAEKPPAVGATGHYAKSGVDVDMQPNEHALVPRGWQRAGALSTLFAPCDGRTRDGVARPDKLVAPLYGDVDKSKRHRPYETLLPTSAKLKRSIETTCEVHTTNNHYDEDTLGRQLAALTAGVTLVCWEHAGIVNIANAIAPSPSVPQVWPDLRYDVIWVFTRQSNGKYLFTQLPQLLLDKDADEVIK